jgi:hypothetical protein
MSLGACLPALEGKIPPEQAAEARALYDELVGEYTRSGSPEAAAALASQGVLEALERQVTRKAFLAGRTIKARRRIAADLGGYGKPPGGGGGGGSGGPIDPHAGPALIDHDPRAPFSNVEGRRKAILGQAHRQIDRILAEHSANLLGQVRNKAQLGDLVRELFAPGSSRNAAAAELAGAWRRTAEGLRARFNAAGGEIGFRADWGLPQSHNWKAVRKAGFQAWRAAILPRLDVAKMIDARTGKPFTRESLQAALPEIWRTIRSDGATHRTPGAPGAKALANRRADPRFFVFKSADDWMAYNAEFGSGTAYDAMIGHIEGMARDIAAMEILGPNPAATLDWVKGTIAQSAELDMAPGSKAVNAASSAGKKIDDLWDEYRGANMEPRNERLALWGSGLRAWQTATKLGGAFLSATSDMAFQASRRRFNGLSNATLAPQYLKLFKPGSIEDQKMAVRRGLIAESWASRTASQSRYLMDEMTGEVPRRLAEGVLRLSLLGRHTQMAKWAYGMETLATYTEAAGKSFDHLEPRQRSALARYGMDGADWDALRSAPMDTDGGVEWLSPHNVGDPELASRFMEMIHEETDIAVPVADLATRAFVNSKLERGTVMGEVGRSLFQFKSFGVSVLIRQAQEIMAMQGAQAARYAGGLLIGTTLMGALAMQLKAIAAGKDPRPMEDEAFWGAAILQGGGFGIFGDFLHSSQSRAGNGFAQTLAGPMVDDAQGIANVIGSKHPERRLVQEAKGFIPGNTLWYTRLAFDRMVADQIQQAIDPDYRKSWKRLDKYAAEQGTGYFWRPGEGQPARAPDFSNALEKGPEE